MRGAGSGFRRWLQWPLEIGGQEPMGIVRAAMVQMAARENKPDQPQYFTLTELMKEFGVTARALRFYETKGLLRPSRGDVARRYDRSDRARLGLLLKGKRFGFTLGEIKDLLDLYEADDNGATQRRAALEKYEEQSVYLRKQIADMTAALKELEESCAKMRRIQEENGEI